MFIHAHAVQFYYFMYIWITTLSSRIAIQIRVAEGLPRFKAAHNIKQSQMHALARLHVHTYTTIIAVHLINRGMSERICICTRDMRIKTFAQ